MNDKPLTCYECDNPPVYMADVWIDTPDGGMPAFIYLCEAHLLEMDEVLDKHGSWRWVVSVREVTNITTGELA